MAPNNGKGKAPIKAEKTKAAHKAESQGQVQAIIGSWLKRERALLIADRKAQARHRRFRLHPILPARCSLFAKRFNMRGLREHPRIRARDFIESLKDATFGALLGQDELEKRSSKTYKYQTSAGQQLIPTTALYPSWGDAVKYSDTSLCFGYDAR
ncbi:hypothetical protein F5Y01DRAFT_319528 [Xylaria sp. FL0043]|nr:hypothetical protein F5Y01DRAFT_319528 [Xylaria sp. FL0043]